MEPLTTESFNNLIQKVNEFEIAENFFSHILYAQIAIFTVIVLILVGLYFLFVPRISKKQIEKEIEKNTEKIEKELGKKSEEKHKNFVEEMKNKQRIFTEEFNKKLTGARGETFRMFGQFWEDKGEYGVAFIWWLRSAGEFASTSAGGKGVRLSLGAATRVIKKVEPYQLDADTISEYQDIFTTIDDKAYKIEKELLDKAFKELLDKRSKTEAK